MSLIKFKVEIKRDYSLIHRAPWNYSEGRVFYSTSEFFLTIVCICRSQWPCRSYA